MTVMDRLFLSDGSLNVRVLGRLITRIENNPQFAEELLSGIYQENNKTIVLGITGSSGIGKSSLINGLIQKFRVQGKKVAVIAIDPSSPFSGGAILGDRIRMQSHSTDSGVFIRSMGTHGRLGGLAPVTVHVLNLLESIGFDLIIIETVGVGQGEIDIMKLVDTVLLVLAPGMGDGIQVLKSGIMEIADIFVVNKADKPGKEQLITEISSLLSLCNNQDNWVPPIVEVVATEYKGLDQLLVEITHHGVFIATRGSDVKHSKLEKRFQYMVFEKISTYILTFLQYDEKFNSWIQEVVTGKINPYAAIRDLDKRLGVSWKS